jgi:hypothetical protein
MNELEIRACLDALTHGEIAAAVTADAEKRLIAFIAEGGSVPGFKAARRRGRVRTWIHEGHARKVLVARGFSEDVLCEKPKLKSVAELERLIGREAVAELWTYPLREVCIVPESSPLERVSYAHD